MHENEVPLWLLYGFPFLFAAAWFAATTMLGFMTGWFSLQAWYEDPRTERPLVTLRGQSGRMGSFVNISNCLTLTSYPSGLGIAIGRIMGPFQKPLLFPWDSVEATPSKMFFLPMMTLELGGRSAEGSLRIRRKVWERLVEPLPPALRARISIVEAI